MRIAEIEHGVEHPWRRSDSWDWCGEKRWWEYTIEVSGYNGAGGWWVIERGRWNGSREVIIYQPRTLSREDTERMAREIAERTEGAP